MQINKRELIGQTVMHRQTKLRGQIESISGERMTVSFYNGESTFMFPAAFAATLILQDRSLQAKLEAMSYDTNFEMFKRQYDSAVHAEINYIKQSGGKRYRLFDGERLKEEKNRYLYTFDTDSELYFPDGTAIKLWQKEQLIAEGAVISCDEFTITLEVREFIGNSIDTVEMTSEQWYLLEALSEQRRALIPGRRNAFSRSGELRPSLST